MSRDEFLKTLSQKLMVLNENEREDILLEYEQHILMKVANGLSEEQAIEDFGDMDDLAKEILDAYHINTAYNQNDFSHKLNFYIKNCAHFLTNFTESLFQKSKSEIGQIFLKFLGLFFGLLVLRWFFQIGIAILYPLINLFPYFISNPISYVFHFIIDVVHLIIAVYLTIFFIKKYVLVDYEPLVISDTVSYTNFQQSNDASPSKEVFDTIKQKSADFKEKITVDSDAATLGDACLKVIELVVKFFAAIFLFSLSLPILGLVIASGVFIVFAIQGIKCVGIAFLLIGGMLITISLFGVIFNFIFGGGR